MVGAQTSEYRLSMDNPEAVSVQVQRRRPPLACDRCRRRKIKCNKTVPCSHCIRTGYEASCTYAHSERYHRSRDPTLPQETLVNIHKEAREPGKAFRDRLGPLSQSAHSRNDVANSYDFFWEHNHELAVSLGANYPQFHSAVRPPGSQVPQPEEEKDLSIQQDNSLLVDQSLPPDSSTNRDEDLLFLQRSILGKSHWWNCVDQVETIVCILKDALQEENSEMKRLLHTCHQLSRALQQHTRPQQSLFPDIRESLPPKEICDRLIDVYLQTTESIFRVVYVPTFQKQYEGLWNNPASADSVILLQVQLTCAVGYFLGGDTEELAFPGLRELCSLWIRAAQEWLDCSPEKSSPTVSGIQVHCILLLVRIVGSSDINETNAWSGLLLQKALIMALHRDPLQNPGLSFFHAEIRRRLWATICEILLQSGMDCGIAPMISVDDFDCKPPCNLDDNQLHPSAGEEIPVAKPMNVFTQTSLQIILMRSLPIRLKVAKVLNGVQPEPSYDETLRLGEELTTACRSNSRLFQSYCDGLPGPSQFHTRVLSLLTYRFLVSLHLPFAAKARTNPKFYFSRKICFETSMFLLSNMSLAVPSGQVAPTDDLVRTNNLNTRLFGHSIVVATIAIGQELLSSSQGDTYSCQFAFPFSESTFSVLERAQVNSKILFQECTRANTCRLRTCEMNIRHHVLLSCVLAYISALETGAPEPEAVLSAALSSLESCRERLEESAKAVYTLGTGSIHIQEHSHNNTPQEIAQPDLDRDAISLSGEEWNDFDLTEIDTLGHYDNLFQAIY